MAVIAPVVSGIKSSPKKTVVFEQNDTGQWTMKFSHRAGNSELDSVLTVMDASKLARQVALEQRKLASEYRRTKLLKQALIKVDRPVTTPVVVNKKV